MSVAQVAKKAVENVYGTVYTVGSASDILCEFRVWWDTYISATCIIIENNRIKQRDII